MTLESGAFVRLSYHDFWLDSRLSLTAFLLNFDVNPCAPLPNDLPEPIPAVAVLEGVAVAPAQNGNPTDQIIDRLDLQKSSSLDLSVADSFATKERSQ